METHKIIIATFFITNLLTFFCFLLKKYLDKKKKKKEIEVFFKRNILDRFEKINRNINKHDKHFEQLCTRIEKLEKRK